MKYFTDSIAIVWVFYLGVMAFISGNSLPKSVWVNWFFYFLGTILCALALNWLITVIKKKDI